MWTMLLPKRTSAAGPAAHGNILRTCVNGAGMRTADFDYDLPPELIAQQPAEPRDRARLMVLRRDRRTWEHRSVLDLPDLLAKGDLLVLNNTRVIPARMFGRKEGSGGRVETLFLEERPDGTWEALVGSRRRPRPGARLVLGSARVTAVLLEDLGDGRARLRVEGAAPLRRVLEEEGRTPLPPYIRRDDAALEAADRARYQTVFAREPGAVAAPTAGLHFTPRLLERLSARGIARTELTLHVGIGTFRPVTAERVEDHRMEAERFTIPEAAVAAIRTARAAGGRVVAVGSTTVRTLEGAAARADGFGPCAGRSDLFIRPPFSFRVVDAMMTNFHLPRSTLLMMVSAFAGREFILQAYAEAVRQRYRFFSYGDGMLIL